MGGAGGGWLRAGTVGRAHGLDGSFHVIGAAPGLLGRATEVRLVRAEGERLAEVAHLGGTPQRPRLRLTGVDSREAAEALRGGELYVTREVAPPLEEDEWWAEDLVACRVMDGQSEVGTVRRLLALPSCEVLEVERGAGGELLVPLVGDAVRSVDIEAGVIDIDLAFLGEGQRHHAD